MAIWSIGDPALFSQLQLNMFKMCSESILFPPSKRLELNWWSRHRSVVCQTVTFQPHPTPTTTPLQLLIHRLNDSQVACCFFWEVLKSVITGVLGIPMLPVINKLEKLLRQQTRRVLRGHHQERLHNRIMYCVWITGWRCLRAIMPSPREWCSEEIRTLTVVSVEACCYC